MEFTEEHLSRLVKTEERSKSNTKRLDEVEKKQENLESLTKSVYLMANEQEHIRADLKETKEDVKEIKEAVILYGQERKEIDEVKGDVAELKGKPAKRWEEVVKVIISAVVGAVITFIAIRLGMK